MKKYEKAQMEVIEFENEDVIATSVCSVDNDWVVDGGNED